MKALHNLATPVSPPEADADVPGTKAYRAYAQIRADILCCRHAPGTKLNISALADDLDVSLGAVREALSKLQSEALVVAEPQRGYTVRPVSAKELAEITEARLALETMCLRASIAKGDLGWETRVVAAWHRLSRLSETDEGAREHLSDQWARAHSEFHGALVDACGNEWLLRMRAMLYEQSERYRRISVPLQGKSRDVRGEHQALFDAAMARDGDRAAAMLESHLKRTETIVASSIAS